MIYKQSQLITRWFTMIYNQLHDNLQPTTIQLQLITIKYKMITMIYNQLRDNLQSITRQFTMIYKQLQ